MTSARKRYLPQGPFHDALTARVEQHFRERGETPNSAPGMLPKTLFILTWWVASWALLVFAASEAWQAALLSISLGFAMAGIGFNVQHDGGHCAYSPRPWLNRLMAFALDGLGGSSYVWNWKHNVFHHTHPNVVGADADIDLVPVARLAPAQPRYAAHRLQHFYIWGLYALLSLKWHFIDDFHDVWTGRVGKLTFPRPQGWEMAAFLLGKGFFFTWALVVPFSLHAPGPVIACFLLTSVTLSLTLAIVFQLAHSVTGVSFTTVDDAPDREWSMHQAETALNFSGNRLLTWYVGGLNHQIEHHLLPRVSHVHLPALSGLVKSTCEEFGVRYHVVPGFFGALRCHFNWVKQLGRAG